MDILTFKLEKFEGPMDLLYHLIEKNKIDIYDIPISSLTDQYLEYLNFTDKDMDSMSSFLLMAATLLEIKSKMLLPKKDEMPEDEVDPREELVERLIEYKKIKDVTETLRELAQEASQVFYKESDYLISELNQKEPQELSEFMQGITAEDLTKAFLDVMGRKEEKIDKIRSDFSSVEKDIYTVVEKIVYIRELIFVRGKTTFGSIFSQGAKRAEKIVTFLALLELIKLREVIISQETTFGEITISAFTKE